MKTDGTLMSFAYRKNQVLTILKDWDSAMMVRDTAGSASVYLYLMNVEPGLIHGTGTTEAEKSLTIGSYVRVRNGGM